MTVDRMSEACNFERIPNKHDDVGKHTNVGGAERFKDRGTGRVWVSDGIFDQPQLLPNSGLLCGKNNPVCVSYCLSVFFYLLPKSFLSDDRDILGNSIQLNFSDQSLIQSLPLVAETD